ncbi:MAG: precorrin-3B C(17)-methyltransferase [Elainellaceae cyanobacterium]
MGSFQSFQPIAAIATTPAGVNVLRSFWESGIATLWVAESLAAELPTECQVSQSIQVYQGALRDHLTFLWGRQQSFVFCLATGAVVRLIAPLLHDKASDPAVVVVDGKGQFVISLCSGHQGGADRLAQAIALQIGATPILTGGANGLGLPAIDTLGTPFGWTKGTGDWTGVSAAVARQEPIQVIQEVGSALWQEHLPSNHLFQFGFPELSESDGPTPKARLWISSIQRQFAPESDLPKAQWHPRVLWVGVGCERNTPRQLIETAIQQVCRAYHLAEGAIAGIATIELKADEPGIIELCRDRHWALRCFSAEALRSVAVPTPSSVVETEVGTPSVAEAAAILASQEWSSVVSHSDYSNQTESPAVEATGLHSLRVSKKIVRQEGVKGAVTVAIAQANQEYTGRKGQLWLVGTGPGALSQITPAAQTAIAQADVVIGYSLYVDLVASLLHPGQIVEALPITQERQRAERAIELAQWGLTVAVISSGDCGIYGMAGLVLEQLRAQNWDGKTPAVQIFPGISALQAAASRVGAPLMHDFCAISLSDLLTPWEVIEQRLMAAAQADFVVSLYNPRSQSRIQQIEKAQQIFLQHRLPTTPVAIVRAAYREQEQVMITTLAQMLDCPIDMLTVVIIGNRSTRTHADWMITPRGYLGFA